MDRSSAELRAAGDDQRAGLSGVAEEVDEAGGGCCGWLGYLGSVSVAFLREGKLPTRGN